MDGACDLMKNICLSWHVVMTSGILLAMGSANGRRRYVVTPPLIGWAHTKNDPWDINKCFPLHMFVLRSPWCSPIKCNLFSQNFPVSYIILLLAISIKKSFAIDLICYHNLSHWDNDSCGKMGFCGLYRQWQNSNRIRSIVNVSRTKIRKSNEILNTTPDIWCQNKNDYNVWLSPEINPKNEIHPWGGRDMQWLVWHWICIIYRNL